ncbi:MAG: 16S rRNA (guanine(966)-N(2))-methyltransferase RsmD [Burkholderiaceae bacterium]|nr:16S rRNA (guanine(966)-N(2))-methyltransferase RsmD [Microbacteriaceae bacterium]
MTRIIAGFAGSLSIHVPPTGTRPTSDRVREAIFSALDARHDIPGARVLDLYAGSGALGLEAASRGAARVDLVDSGSVAAGCCRRNAEIVRKAAPATSALRIEVSASRVQSFLTASTGHWDLVFLDPPYDLDEAELTLNLAALVVRLAPGAVVLVERGSRSPEPVWPRGIVRDRSKKHGDTTLWWARETD